MVKEIEKRGYLQRVPDPEDKRAQRIRHIRAGKRGGWPQSNAGHGATARISPANKRFRTCAFMQRVEQFGCS